MPLSPKRLARLMGFDKWCEDKIVVSDTQAWAVERKIIGDL